MTRKQLFGVVALGALFFAPKVTAQYYYPMAVSGFTEDVIVNGVGSASTSTTSAVDDASFAYISKDFQATASNAVPLFGLPVNGQFMTIATATPGLTFQLNPYSGSNSLKLNNTGDTGTLTFATPTPAFNLFFMATGGSGLAIASAIVTFTDNTTQSFTNLSVADWYNGSTAAIQGIGRVNLTNNNLEDGGGINPRIYQINMAIDPANQSKAIQSVSFTKTSTATTGSGRINIFGISANKYTTCLAPTAVTASAVTISGGTLNWTAPATVPASYDVYYTSSTFAPSTTTAPSLSGITSTTATMSGLTPQTRFHVWIRSNCTGNMGEWAYGTTFVTPCSTFTAPYTENFDTTAVGSSTNTNAPNCWSYLESTSFAGYGYVIGSNSFSAPNSYYLYNSSATTGSQMLVSPSTVNLSDGSKRVRFYAKSSSANVPLQIGTLSNPTDPATFTPIGSAISLTTTQTLYTVNLPAGSDVYLAFKHGMGTTLRGIYLDNVTVQAIPTCFEPTAITSSNVNANTATVGWTAPTPAPANGYEVYYSTLNFEPASNVVLNASNSVTSTGLTAQINGLSPSTTYYAWVRSNCGTTDKSIWSLTSTTFTTPCTAITALPWNENFDNMTALGANVLPNCWKQTAGGSGQNFSSSNASGNNYNDPKSAPNYITIYYPYNNPGYLWTPMISMVAGTTYNFSFYWVGDGLTGWQNEVIVNSSQIATGATSLTTFLSPTDTATGGSNSTNYTQVTVSYTPTTTGDYAFAIKANNTTTAPYYMGFDDFSVSSTNLATAESIAKQKNIKVSPNPFNDIINISEFKDIKSIRVSDVSGRTLKTIENPEAQIYLGDLNAGLYLLNLQFKDGSQKSVKVIKK